MLPFLELLYSYSEEIFNFFLFLFLKQFGFAVVCTFFLFFFFASWCLWLITLSGMYMYVHTLMLVDNITQFVWLKICVHQKIKILMNWIVIFSYKIQSNVFILVHAFDKIDAEGLDKLLKRLRRTAMTKILQIRLWK